MKYKCLSDECKHLNIVYSETVVNHINPDGTDGSICIRCNTEYSPVEDPNRKDQTVRATRGSIESQIRLENKFKADVEKRKPY